MRPRFLLLPLLPLVVGTVHAQRPAPNVERRTAASHPIRYLISRPVGWRANTSYPVVVAIEAADREFDKTARAFIDARGNRPYVIVVPEVLTAGPSVRRAASFREPFDYDAAVWQRIMAGTDCAFDSTGMAAVVADVRRLDSPGGPFLLTAWEAGGHVLWYQYFKLPGNWAAFATVAPNYIGRCMDDGHFTNVAPAGGPPVRMLYTGMDSAMGPGGILYSQWLTVKELAARAGHTSMSEQRVPHTPHGPMPVEVLAWFDSLRAAGTVGH